MYKSLSFFLALTLVIVVYGNFFTERGSENHAADAKLGKFGRAKNGKPYSKESGRTAQANRLRKHYGYRPNQDDEESEQDVWSDESLYDEIQVDVATTAKVALLTETGKAEAFFKIKVPRQAKTMTLTLDELPVIASMYGMHGTPLKCADEATDVNPVDTSVVTVSRFDYVSPLEGGWFYLVVEIDSDDVNTVLERGLETLDVTVTARVNLARVDGQLEPGKKISSSLSPDVGCFRTFELRIPEGADAIRLDLDRSQADLNLLVRQQRQILDTQYADDYSEELESRESLVLRRSDFDDFDSSKWFVEVYAPFNETFTTFDIYLTIGTKPPNELLVLPDLKLKSTSAENAMLSTVQIGTQTGAASGTLVSADGLILTNYHVISEANQYAKLLNDESENDVVVAITVDPNFPPIEYFVGEVIEQSVRNDLALVRIKSGYYGQPLPEGYQFPCVQCRTAESADLGSAIRICGFPASGSVENNPTFSIASGVLSGFLGNRYLKTDADIASGNSGGGGFDEQWRLIGVPTMTIDDPAGSGPTMGILMSLELVPESWGLAIAK